MIAAITPDEFANLIQRDRKPAGRMVDEAGMRAK